MSLLEREEAKVLLNDAMLTASTVQGCRRRVTAFLERYLPVSNHPSNSQGAGVSRLPRSHGKLQIAFFPIHLRAGASAEPIQLRGHYQTNFSS